MNRQSLSFQVNLISVLIVALIIVLSATFLYLGQQVNQATKKTITVDMPVALLCLELLEELDDMHTNVLEYILGNKHAKQSYNENYKELIYYYNLLPKDFDKKSELDQLLASIEENRDRVNNELFLVYDPEIESQVKNRVERLINTEASKLRDILEGMKNKKIRAVESSFKDRPLESKKLRYYIGLYKKAHFMLYDLEKYYLGDSSSQYNFQKNRDKFLSFISELKLISKDSDLDSLNEIEKVFEHITSESELIFTIYSPEDKRSALNIIKNVETIHFRKAEKLLDLLSQHGTNIVNEDMDNLRFLTDQTLHVILFLMVVTIIFFFLIFNYAKERIFSPINIITKAIKSLRQGQRDLDFVDLHRKDELALIINDLNSFQLELIELDKLREKDKETQEYLKAKKEEAELTLQQLKETQSMLIQNEKLASLGSLVAGIAHEINTPIGVSVTISSTINENNRRFISDIKSGQITKTQLTEFEKTSEQSFNILLKSLSQASDLIFNFKQVATDQTSEKRRVFDLGDMIEEVISTLRHTIKNKKIDIVINANEVVEMDSFPGPLGQVLTNLFNNSVLHAFDTKSSGVIDINYQVKDESVIIKYFDNGKGVPEKDLNKVFDPFYTTKLGQGGSGLGLNIIYNIVTNILSGSIHATSEDGLLFEIIIPKIAPIKSDDHIFN